MSEGELELDGGVLKLLAEGGAAAGLFAEELALQALFVMLDEGAPPLRAEPHSAVVRLEMPLLKDAVGEEPQRERLDEGGPEGLHQVQGERPAAVFRLVETTERGVKSPRDAGGEEFAINQGRKVGETSVDGIARRPGGTVAERKLSRQKL